MTTDVNFLGIPIDGDINKAGERTPQRPLSELEPLIRAVLDDPTMHSFGWTQYTPYFNDGDPCVFRVGEPWFKTVGDVDESKASADDEDDYSDDDRYTVLYGDHPSLGERDYDWVNREKVYKTYRGPDEARYDRCLTLAQAIDSSAFDDVLLAAFGDHCQVTVRKDRIVVHEYSHD